MGLWKRMAAGGGAGFRASRAGGVGFGPIDFRFHLNFRTSRVAKAADRRARGILSAGGAFVRKAAQHSLRYARPKTLAEMAPAERKRYEIWQPSRFRRRPERASKPGEPPLLHMRPSPLKRLILFAWDPGRRSVVIGPLRHGRRPGAMVLEYGGYARIRGKRRYVRARPFMRPALAQGIADLKRKGTHTLPRSWNRLARSG